MSTPMSTPLLSRDFPGLGEPMELPRIVEDGAEPHPLPTTPKRLLHLGADTGRGVVLDHEPSAGIDLSTLVAIPESDPADVADNLSADLAVTDRVEAEPESLAGPESESEDVAIAGLEAPAKQVKRFSLIDPNQQWVMFVAIGLLSSILAASLVSSFTSVYAAASWVGLPVEVQWLPVVILDVAIVGFSWALMVFASRLADPDLTLDRQKIVRERTWSTRLWLTLVTLYSVAANFLHTYDHWAGDLASPQAIMGAVFSASIPLMALVATEELIRLVFIRRRNVNEEDAA